MRDLQTLEFHLLGTGHFALEEDGDAIPDHIRRFMTTHVTRSKMASCQPTFTSIADKNPLSQPGAVSQMINYQTQLNIA